MTDRLGIDFGTANTVVARWNDTTGTGEAIPLSGVEIVREAGALQRVVPSLIAYSCVDDRRWLGAQVTPALRADPEVAVFRSTKTAITGRVLDLPRPVGDRRVTAARAAADFLGDIMTLASLETATEPELVVTAPVESFDPYRDWLVREVAGDLARLRVVDEATAAAAGYGATLKPGDVFGVFDFGAGTLDVSVVTVVDPDRPESSGGSGVRVISKVGLDLGGDHIDATLAEAVSRETGLAEADTAVHNRVFAELLIAAETAKIALTTQAAATVAAVDPLTGREWSAEVTRDGFTGLLREADILGRVGRAFRKALDTAAAKGHPADSLRYLFLVGGSSLLPQVREVLTLQVDPALLRQDRPLEAVATGAAAIAAGHDPVDFVQHDYAIRHVARGGYEFEPVVPAGTDYPSTEPVASLTITAIHEGQTRFGLAIYEKSHASARDSSAGLEIMFDASGGARTVAVTPQRRFEQSQVWLNEEQLTFLSADPPARAGADRFRLEFHVDAQKRLTVSAFDLERRIWVLDRRPVVGLA